MLDKRFQLGGLQVGGPRTSQNTARFRVANNVYQTRDDYMVPRADNVSYTTGYTGATKTLGVFRYKDKPFVLGTDGTKYLGFYESTAQIPSSALPGPYGSLGPQAVEKLGNLYFNFPQHGLFKYDGFQFYRAGTPLPYGQVLEASAPIAFYVRLIQHHIDQQGNVVSSGYTETPARYSSGTDITVRTDKGATDYFAGERPKLELASEANNYLAHYIKVVTWALVSGNTYKLTTGGDHKVAHGEYLLWKVSTITDAGVTYRAVAYQVITSDATSVTVGNPRYIDNEGSWKNLTNTVPFHPDDGDYLAHYWISVWTSTVATGNYVLQDVIPSCYESNSSKTFAVTFANANVGNFVGTAFNLEGNLGDIYDVTSSKMVFPVTGDYKPTSFSTYGDMGLVSYSNEIYYSDVSLGGSFEMTSGLSFIAVGEGDDGNIQSIAGTSDFLLVSRQFKNYYVSGSLPTANYRVSEITQTSLGAYSNESSIAVNDKVIFFNKQGIWALYSGGRCEEVSTFIKGLFSDFSSTVSFSEEAYFNLDSYPTFASTTAGFFVRPRLDVNRNLLVFAIADAGQGRALVLNLNNGEFYTWSSLTTAGSDFQDICFIDGRYYLTKNAPGAIGISKEDVTVFTYIATDPARLDTTWFTANEPSLEKKLQQLKVWGLLQSPMEVNHCIDWMDSTLVSDGVYTTPIPELFSHKRQLKPANFQSVSVSMKFGGKFQIEGIEIQFAEFQQGMKR